MDNEPIQKIKIPAEPTSITVDVSKTALIIVDMQNAFVRKGAYFDLSGYDISRTERIIPTCQSVIQTAREKGITIIYLRMIRDRPSPGSARGLAFISKIPHSGTGEGASGYGGQNLFRMRLGKRDY